MEDMQNIYYPCARSKTTDFQSVRFEQPEGGWAVGLDCGDGGIPIEWAREV